MFARDYEQRIGERNSRLEHLRRAQPLELRMMLDEGRARVLLTLGESALQILRALTIEAEIGI